MSDKYNIIIANLNREELDLIFQMYLTFKPLHVIKVDEFEDIILKTGVRIKDKKQFYNFETTIEDFLLKIINILENLDRGILENSSFSHKILPDEDFTNIIKKLKKIINYLKAP